MYTNLHVANSNNYKLALHNWKWSIHNSQYRIHMVEITETSSTNARVKMIISTIDWG